MTDHEWYELVKAGDEAGWKLVWERVVEPEASSVRSAEMMRRYSLAAGDLMGMLYDEMIGRGKIALYRDDGGSFEGWLRRYARGFVLAADPAAHGEISIDAPAGGQDCEAAEPLALPDSDKGVERAEAWRMTHLCFRDLWNEDPERAYIHLLKTRFFLSSEEIAAFLDVSSSANVDQIFSRSVKFMREAWVSHDRNGIPEVKG